MSFRVLRRPFLKCFLDVESKEIPAQFGTGGENFTRVTIHEQQPGKAVLQLRQIRVPPVVVVNLRPGHALALRELSNQPAVPGVIRANSQDFKSVIAEACIGVGSKSSDAQVDQHFRRRRGIACGP